MAEVESQTITVRVANALRDVRAAEWDACAGDDNPFVSHAFLEALESSGCVRAKTGWAPYHLLVQDDDERLLGCVPLYLKGHSHRPKESHGNRAECFWTTSCEKGDRSVSEFDAHGMTAANRPWCS